MRHRLEIEINGKILFRNGLSPTIIIHSCGQHPLDSRLHARPRAVLRGGAGTVPDCVTYVPCHAKNNIAVRIVLSLVLVFGIKTPYTVRAQVTVRYFLLQANMYTRIRYPPTTAFDILTFWSVLLPIKAQ